MGSEPTKGTFTVAQNVNDWRRAWKDSAQPLHSTTEEMKSPVHRRNKRQSWEESRMMDSRVSMLSMVVQAKASQSDKRDVNTCCYQLRKCLILFWKYPIRESGLSEPWDIITHPSVPGNSGKRRLVTWGSKYLFASEPILQTVKIGPFGESCDSDMSPSGALTILLKASLEYANKDQANVAWRGRNQRNRNPLGC